MLPKIVFPVCLLLACSSILAAGLDGRHSDTVDITPVPGLTQHYILGKVTMTPDGRDAMVNFQSKRGIFSFNIAVPPKLASLTLIVENEKHCEGLDFLSKAGEKVELRRAEGVSIQPRGEHLAIEIKGKALESIRAGGKIQFINLYR